MRYSIARTAAIAFLSLGGALLGVNTAPSGLGASIESASLFDKRVSPVGSRPATPQRLAVPDLTQYQYSLRDTQVDTSDMGHKWEVIKNKKIIDVLGIDAAKHLMAIGDAHNEDDTASNKLKLRELVLSTWVHVTRKNVRDIKVIVYKTIQNQAVKASIDKAFDHMKTTLKSVRVRPTDTDAFQELMMGNVFGGGVAKVVSDYQGMEGRQISYIDVTKQWSYEVTFHLS